MIERPADQRDARVEGREDLAPDARVEQPGDAPEATRRLRPRDVVEIAGHDDGKLFLAHLQRHQRGLAVASLGRFRRNGRLRVDGIDAEASALRRSRGCDDRRHSIRQQALDRHVGQRQAAREHHAVGILLALVHDMGIALQQARQPRHPLRVDLHQDDDVGVVACDLGREFVMAGVRHLDVGRAEPDALADVGGRIVALGLLAPERREFGDQEDLRQHGRKQHELDEAPRRVAVAPEDGDGEQGDGNDEHLLARKVAHPNDTVSERQERQGGAQRDQGGDDGGEDQHRLSLMTRYQRGAGTAGMHEGPAGSGPPESIGRGIGRDRRHVDDIGILGFERDDLHRLVETDQKRADDGAAAQFLQHLGRYRGRVEGGHDQHVGRAGQAAERVLLAHQAVVQRDVRRHLAVILEVDAALVEDPDGLHHALGTFAGRMAEGGIGKQRHARLVAHAPGHAGRLLGDVGDLLRIGHVVNGRIGHHHRAPSAERDRHADHPVPRLGVDDAAYVVEHRRIVSRHAGDDGIGVAERHHAGGEVVAVVVDEPLAVAQQEPLALHAFVEMVGIDAVAARQARVDDLDAGLVEVDAGILGRLADSLLATDEDGRAELLVHVGDGGAHHLLLFALGEDRALRLAPHAIVDALECRGDGVAPGRELLGVFLEIEDGAAGHARIHRRLRHRDRDGRDQSRIERHGDDVAGAEFRPHALVGRRDVVGHVLAGKGCERAGCRDLHVVVDGARAHVERAAEDVGEAEHVVDLVRIVRTAGRHDRVGTDVGDFLGRDLGVRIGHGEDDRVLRHRLDHRRR